MDHPRRRRWWIDVKTISCRGVKSFVPFQKPYLYAILSLVLAPDDDDDEQQQQQRTPVDLDGGENPEWDHPMRLSFSSPRVGPPRPPPLLLRFDVAARSIPLLGDKVLAAAQVPVAHLLNATAEESPAGALRHLSYELRAPDGKPNGVLTFSFRITTLGVGGGGITDHVDPSFNVGAPISACAPQYSPPTTNVVLYPPLDYPPPPEIYPPPPPPPLFPDPEPLYPPPGTRFPFQAHDLELYPPPSVPAPVACYPPQDPGCSCPTPRGTYGCPTENGWDRRGLFGGSN
ncbi:protein SRC2 homolog [Ananas comosus]|uniref:Protein SRC2 homolog n=1 Tax=Ananas comosus TaxID=4615 RepID=A0A6P5GN51_ANACO|nr:protein SRC2 homolog [Ananas comosus]